MQFAWTSRGWMALSIVGLLSLAIPLQALQPHTIVVDPEGSGDFKTLTEAMNSLPLFTYERTVIFLKNGVYEEKIRIEQDNITLRGESREGVKIIGNLPRQQWQDNKDAIGPAVINLVGDDIIIENLTIENTQPYTLTHAFAIYGKGTRTIIQNANVWSNGGDTVSLWNDKEGLYYHANCDFRGAVDFVCPRGWCYIENSDFTSVRQTAALWHAGGHDKDQKFVLRNCSFDGKTPFELGRHHYDAQFFLIDCNFSDAVMDKAIYRVIYEDSNRNRPDNWGNRTYFHNSHKPGLDWTKDNLHERDPQLKPETITASWTFAGTWNPESTASPRIIRAAKRTDGKIDVFFNEAITVRGTPILQKGLDRITYCHGAGSHQLTFEGTLANLNGGVELNTLKIESGALIGTLATCTERHYRGRDL